MNVLVVGGAGYVGGAVTDRLIENGSHRVRVYDSLLYEAEYRKPVEFIYGDIREDSRLGEQLRWADAVVWLAALVGDEACAADPEPAVAINQQRVEWLASRFDRRIVFLSTCSVYGADEELLDEKSAVNPLSLYSRTKLAAEQCLRDSPGAIIFRLATLYGVSDAFSRIRMDLVVNTLTARAFFHRRFTVLGGAQYRPLLHVRDAAEAVAANLETALTGIYNLHQVNVRIAELAASVERHFPGVVAQTGVAGADRRTYRVSSEKARQAFGFAPRRTVDEGIVELKQLFEQRRIRDVNNRRYSNASFIKSLLDAPATPLGYEIGRKI